MTDSVTVPSARVIQTQASPTHPARALVGGVGESWRSRAAFAAIAALQIVLVTTHVHWRDEVQALLIAQESRSLAELFANLRYEGHPALWYLVLRAASLVVPSPAVLPTVQAVVGLGTLSLLWRCAPFPSWMKAAAGTSYFLLYEYGTIARSYGLGVLLVFAVMALRRRPVAWLLLALMANVALHFAALSAVLVGLMIIERRWSAEGAAVWALGLVGATLTMMPAGDAAPAVRLFPDQFANAMLAVHSLSAALVPVDVTRPVFIWNVMMPYFSGIGIGIATVAVGAIGFRADQRFAALYVAAYAGLAIIFATIYFGQVRHAGLLFVLMLALEWARSESAPKGAAQRTSPALVAWLVVACLSGYWAAGWALASPVTSARELTDWIAAQGLERAVWAAEPGLYGVEITGRFRVSTYNLDKECLNTFVRWTIPEERTPLPELSARLRAGAAANGGRLHVLTYRDLSEIPDVTLKLLTALPRDRMLDHKYVYEVTVPFAGPATALPRCR